MTKAGLDSWFDEHATALRRLARSVVRDPHRADDVVQATLLRALGATRPPLGAIGRWLAAILRNEARRVHRDEGRRARREEIAARAEAVPAADREVERIAVLRALLAALDELPAEQREAVTLRHLDGLPLREVAARQGVPVRAAETRIRRALERLRAQLDGKFGDRFAWLPLIAPCAAGAGGTVAATAWIMMKGKLVVAAAALCLVWIIWPSADVPAVSTDSGPPVDVIASTATVASSAVDAPAAEAVERTAVDTPSAPGAATVSGRFVDALGVPIAGVRVSVRGREDRSSGGIDEWLLTHGRIAWTDPEPVTSDVDGRFAVRLEPPPPCEFSAEFEHAYFARLSATLGHLDVGENNELGEIELVPGARLSGVVVDEDGVPQDGIGLFVMADSVDRTVAESFHAGGGFNPVSGVDGRFDSPGLWSPGRYRFEPNGLRVLEPTAPVHVAAPATEVRIVVARVDPASLISGCVVDTDGRPLWGARIRADSFRAGSSLQNGRFRITKDVGDPGVAAKVRVDRTGYEPVDLELAWGARDVRIVLARGDALVLHVTDGDGASVDRFGVRIAQMREHVNDVPRPPTVKRFGDHEGGTLVIPGVRSDQRWVRVEPQSNTGLLASAFLDLGEAPVTQRDLAVVLRAARTRVLRIVDGAAQPVVGAAIELLEAGPGMSVELDSQPVDPLRFTARSSAAWAIAVQRARTDEHGELTLVGPGDRPLALRYLGPHGVPFVRRDVRLDDPSPLVVTLALGARVVGRVEPPELIGDWRERAGLPRTGAVDASMRDRLPTAGLFRTGAVWLEQHPPANAGRRIEIGADGTFEIEGAPDGDWELRVGDPPVLGAVRSLVGLRSGETRRVDFDLAGARPSPVRVRLDFDRASQSAAFVRFEKLDQTKTISVAGQREENGDAIAWLTAGTWRVVISVRVATGSGFEVDASPPIVVAPATPSDVSLRVRTGSVPIRVVDADGVPVAGLTLTAVGSWSALAGAATDAEGRTTLHGGIGEFALQTRVHSLMSESAWQRFGLDHRGDDAALQAAWLAVGSVVLSGAPSVEVELRLPAEWSGR